VTLKRTFYGAATDSLQEWAVTGVEETMSRLHVLTSNSAIISGRLNLTYFRAKSARQVTTAIFPLGTTVAGATPTISRIGLYSIDASGNGTLVASTTNDTALFSTGATTKAGGTKSLSATYTFVSGQLYAAGPLVVSAAAMPSFYGHAALPPTALDAPRKVGHISGQTDLPASFVVASLATSTAVAYYGEFV
jgi:hypothetical protein